MILISSVILLSNSFAQASFGLGDYDYISEWGSFGIKDAGHFSHPQFIAVGDDGSVYVSDLGNKRVQKCSSAGQYVSELGKSGKLPGECHDPSGIAVSDDSVFVADRDLNRIQKFSTDGEFILQWGVKGIYDGQFYFPNGIAVNNGTVYVVDTGNQRIQAFSTDGDFIFSFGSSGLGEGQFLNVAGIDIDGDGNVYVTDKGNGKIEKFDASGNHLQAFPFHSSNYVFAPEAIAVDPSGEMFIVNAANNRILHLSQDSNLNLNIFDQTGPYPDSFKIITDIAIGVNGELLVVDSAKHSIKSYKTSFYTQPVTVDHIPYVEIVEDFSYDKTKPVITAPISLIVEADDFFTDVDFGNAVATDDSGIKTILNNAPEAFSPGVTTVIWIAFDPVGYSASDYQTITITTCGQPYSDYNMIKGTPNDDVIQGTDGNDLIFGLAGNDLVSGGLGDDCIFGGSGDDVILGEDGDDTIKGNSGHDILKGQSGIDILYANSGSDVMDGGLDSDRCYLDSEKDLLLNCEN